MSNKLHVGDANYHPSSYHLIYPQGAMDHVAKHTALGCFRFIVNIRPACLLQGKRPHVFGMTASPVNTRAKQTQMKVSEAVWQLERNMDAQVITVINREPVIAAAPLPELKLVYYVRQHVSDALKEVEGDDSIPLTCSVSPCKLSSLMMLTSRKKQVDCIEVLILLAVEQSQ